MKKNRRRFLGSLCAAFLLPFAATSLASCQETILSFHDLQTMGFSSVKGVGVGRKSAPQAEEKKNAIGAQVDKQGVLTLNKDKQIQDITWGNDQGQEEKLNLNLYRYATFGKYAVMIFGNKEFDHVDRFDFPENYYEGHWYFFIYSFITGKLYYFNIEGADNFDCIKSRGNHISARANGFFNNRGDGYTLLDMYETSQGLVVKKQDTLYKILLNDEQIPFDPMIWDVSFSNEGNSVIGGYFLKKSDGTFKKSNYCCGQLVNGDLAAINKNDDGTLSYYLIDENLNFVPYEGEEAPLFRFSDSLSVFYERKFQIGSYEWDSAEVLYEDSDDIIYKKIRGAGIYHISIDSEGNEEEEFFGYPTVVSQKYLFGDKFVFMNMENHHIYEYDVKTQELADAYTLPVADPLAGYQYWQYGPEGYMYIKYTICSTEVDEKGKPLSSETVTGMYVDGKFKRVPMDDSYFNYEIMPTFLDEISEYIKDTKSKETSEASDSLLSSLESA